MSEFARWDFVRAKQLCTRLAQKAPNYGCHIALTGGCLYKEEFRKDLDIVLYRIRQVDKIDWKGLFDFFKTENIDIVRNCGFVKKAIYKNNLSAKAIMRSIDFLYPEYSGGDDCPIEQDPTHSIYGDIYP